MKNHTFLNEIINRLNSWSQFDKDYQKSRRLFIYTSYFEESPKIIHYTQEIIRYYSKINYISKKILRSLKYDKDVLKANEFLFHFLIYRILWEHVPISGLKAEIQDSYPEFLDSINFEYLYHRISQFDILYALKSKTNQEKVSIEFAIPNFFIQHLLPVMPIEVIKQNCIIMDIENKKGKLNLRINCPIDNLIFESEKIQKEFNFNKISWFKDENFPELLQVERSQWPQLQATESYKRKKVIPMEKPSFTCIKILNPQSHEQILDLCAAPGIKTGAILNMNLPFTHLIVNEFNSYRLNDMQKFLEPLQYSKPHYILSDGTHPPFRNLIPNEIPDNRAKFDKILIDAPCTGSGTFGSNPELKWRQNDLFLNLHIKIQKMLIENALNMIKPNGQIVYATCSLYPEEGEYHFRDLAEKIQFINLPSWISPGYTINNQKFEGIGRFFPLTHKTQGFFIACFTKK